MNHWLWSVYWHKLDDVSHGRLSSRHADRLDRLSGGCEEGLRVSGDDVVRHCSCAEVLVVNQLVNDWSHLGLLVAVHEVERSGGVGAAGLRLLDGQ